MDPTPIHLPGGKVVLYASPQLREDYDDLFTILLMDTPWEQRSVEVYGKIFPQPRQIAWYSPYSYTYSGLRLEPRALTPLLEKLSNQISKLVNHPFNGVLLNLYLDGKSSIGMHSDDEPEFGHNPVIASLSLGEERILKFARKDKSEAPVNIPLTHGSLLVMSGDTQRLWKHGIAKTTTPVGPRINLTFRNIVNPTTTL